MSAPRVLLVGWSSVLHGEATAGDVLSVRAVQAALEGAGVDVELAWSPVMATAPGAGGMRLDDADPARYSHLVWACGPLHGRAVAEVAERFAQCRRVAVGVSVVDGADPGLGLWDLVLARDAPGGPPVRDLAAGPAAALADELAGGCGGGGAGPVPGAPRLVGVYLAPGQAEYGARRRHDQVGAVLGEWLAGLPAARLALDTRLDPRGWRDPHTPGEVLAVLGRCDVVVTSRLHGLVLALAAGVPAVAVDPVAGGGKVSAQAAAWGWPVVAAADLVDREREQGAMEGALEAALGAALAWCASEDGRLAACAARRQAPTAGAEQLALLVGDVLSAP